MAHMLFHIHRNNIRHYHQKENGLTESHMLTIMEKVGNSWDWKDRIKCCSFLNQLTRSKESTGYMDLLKKYQMSTEEIPVDSGAVLKKDDHFFGSFLYFSALIYQEENSWRLKLQPPERAFNRRIYRKFGSHRFFEIKVPPKTPHEIYECFLRPLWLCGRLYKFLWAKKDKCPQTYVFFAERGKGIDEECEIDVAKVQQWMFPPDYNEDLSMKRFFKRTKLSFSKTIPAGVLPPNCVEIVPDITGENGIKMTDGCGLISRDLLAYLRNNYNSYVKTEEDLVIGQNNSKLVDNGSNSFQGRLGGIKGIWVLDPRLKGMKLICRESQVCQLNFTIIFFIYYLANNQSQNKFTLPMKCMGNVQDQMTYDIFYDTMDICSWDFRSEDSSLLSVSLIQILEYRGVTTDFFEDCADTGTTWVTEMKRDLDQGNNRSLIEKCPEKISDEHERGAYDLLYHMAIANIGIDEPAMQNLVCNMWRKEIEKMRDKV